MSLSDDFSKGPQEWAGLLANPFGNGSSVVVFQQQSLKNGSWRPPLSKSPSQKTLRKWSRNQKQILGNSSSALAPQDQFLKPPDDGLLTA